MVSTVQGRRLEGKILLSSPGGGLGDVRDAGEIGLSACTSPTLRGSPPPPIADCGGNHHEVEVLKVIWHRLLLSYRVQTFMLTRWSWWVKAAETKPDKLNLIPGTHTVEGEK